MHVNVIALVIEDVNADPDIFFSRDILACVGNALGSRKIDHREIMNALRCFAADDKGGRRPDLRGSSCSENQCHTKQTDSPWEDRPGVKRQPKAVDRTDVGPDAKLDTFHRSSSRTPIL
jgi:hypothetical protein